MKTPQEILKNLLTFQGKNEGIVLYVRGGSILMNDTKKDGETGEDVFKRIVDKFVPDLINGSTGYHYSNDAYINLSCVTNLALRPDQQLVLLALCRLGELTVI